MFVELGVLVLPVKVKLLNTEPVEIAGIDEPEVSERFGTVDTVAPAVLPTEKVRVTAIPEVKPPVPDQVKLVRVAIPNTVCAAVVCDKTILVAPKAIALVLVLLELNMPVVKLNPFKDKPPLVSVVVPVATNDSASLNVVVPDTLLILNARMVLPLLRIPPVSTIFKLNDVNVPLADNVIVPDIFNVVAARAKAVVPKLRLSNQLPDVSVIIATPAPVNDKLGAFVLEPPVVPNTHVLVTAALAVNPPVPVYVKLVASAILNTVCAAVVCASTILFEPKEIALVLVLLELKIPVVRSKPPSANVPAVNVVVLVATREGLSPNVNVPPARLKPIPPNCLLNCVVHV